MNEMKGRPGEGEEEGGPGRETSLRVTTFVSAVAENFHHTYPLLFTRVFSFSLVYPNYGRVQSIKEKKCAAVAQEISA